MGGSVSREGKFQIMGRASARGENVGGGFRVVLFELANFVEVRICRDAKIQKVLRKHQKILPLVRRGFGEGVLADNVQKSVVGVRRWPGV